MSEWDRPKLTEEQRNYAAVDAYAALKLYECVNGKRTVRDYAKLTQQTAVAGAEVVLMARSTDLEVARGEILLPPTASGVQPWAPAYLDGAAGGVRRPNLTTTRMVVALTKIVSPAAVLLYPTEEGVLTLGAARLEQELRSEDVVEVHVLWDVGRARLVDAAAAGGGAAGAGGAGVGEEADGAPVHTVETTGNDGSAAVEDEWENGRVVDEEVLRELGPPLPSDRAAEEEGDGAGAVVLEEEEDEGEEEAEDDDEEGGGWGTTGCPAHHGCNVKLDILHAHQRITRTTNKDHGAYRALVARLRDAVMAPVRTDVEAVKRRLIAKGVVSEDGWKEYYGRNFLDVLKYCRREVPKPSVLMERLRRVEAVYARIPDGVTGQPLFKARTWKRWAALLRHVEMGCLSDPPPHFVPLYFKVGERRDGTDILGCGRGTSDLEVSSTRGHGAGWSWVE
jgi:hypothetical protein